MGDPREVKKVTLTRRKFLELTGLTEVATVFTAACNELDRIQLQATPTAIRSPLASSLIEDGGVISGTATATALFNQPKPPVTPSPTPRIYIPEATPTPTAELRLKNVLDIFTEPYPGIEGARVLKITENTAADMSRDGANGDLYFNNSYVTELIELAFNREIAALGEKARNQYYDLAAAAIINGLKKAYPDKSRRLIVALNAGHMSNILLNKMNQANKERAAKGLPLFQSLTRDTGTAAGGVAERVFNHAVCERIAARIKQDPECANWIPVLNSPKEGFPADRLKDDNRGFTGYYGDDEDTILPMNLLEDRIGMAVEKIGGIDMVALSIHHNDSGNQSLRGGTIYMPNTGTFKEKSEEVGNILAASLRREIPRILGGYNCSSLVLPGKVFYWMLDVGNSDDPQRVKDGDLSSGFTCASNYMAARMRNWALSHPS